MTTATKTPQTMTPTFWILHLARPTTTEYTTTPKNVLDGDDAIIIINLAGVYQHGPITGVETNLNDHYTDQNDDQKLHPEHLKPQEVDS